jgi:hypothetical protein
MDELMRAHESLLCAPIMAVKHRHWGKLVLLWLAAPVVEVLFFTVGDDTPALHSPVSLSGYFIHRRRAIGADGRPFS